MAELISAIGNTLLARLLGSYVLATQGGWCEVEQLEVKR